MVKFKLDIPEKVSSNKIYSGLHWSKRVQLKDLYHTSLLEYKNKFKVDEFPVRIIYSFFWKTTPLDTSNQFFMIKMIEDAMVKIGLLPDDSPTYVRESVSRGSRGEKDYVEITIEPFQSLV